MFQNNEAALSEASSAALELSADRLRRGLAIDEEFFDVEDANGSSASALAPPENAGLKKPAFS